MYNMITVVDICSIVYLKVVKRAGPQSSYQKKKTYFPFLVSIEVIDIN